MQYKQKKIRDKILSNLKCDLSFFQIKVSTKQSELFILTAAKGGPFKIAMKVTLISPFVFFWLANAQLETNYVHLCEFLFVTAYEVTKLFEVIRGGT